MSAILKTRIRNPEYLKKLTSPEEAIKYFQNGQYLGWSGFTGVGGPKVIPEALAKHVEDNNLQGKMRFSLFVGASAGAGIEGRWAENGMIARRSPHQVCKPIEKNINNGSTYFFDKHLSMFPQDLQYGFYTLGKKTPGLDIAIIEASAITEEGLVIPSASVGSSPELVDNADKIIIELNTKLPSFEGLHDINHIPNPPFRKPINITRVDERCGEAGLRVDPKKVVAVVESDMAEATGTNSPEDEVSKAIGAHLIEFFKNEVKQGRLPANLLPLQSGIGNIANAVVGGLAGSDFRNLTVYTEVLQDSFLSFWDSGALDFASATSIRLTDAGFEKFFANWDSYAPKLVLRSQQVSNSPEVIRRLGCIAMNTPVEVDIYGHANSTNVMGSRMLHGLGGSADFLRNSKLSIMHTPSARASKVDEFGLSCIVPFASHIDQTEHDLDIIVTEQGLADVRGLAPRERSRVIIENCAHPVYKPILMDYVKEAEKYCTMKKSLHEPHSLRNAFKFHTNYEDKGTMRVTSWD